MNEQTLIDLGTFWELLEAAEAEFNFLISLLP